MFWQPVFVAYSKDLRYVVVCMDTVRQHLEELCLKFDKPRLVSDQVNRLQIGGDSFSPSSFNAMSAAIRLFRFGQDEGRARSLLGDERSTKRQRGFDERIRLEHPGFCGNTLGCHFDVPVSGIFSIQFAVSAIRFEQRCWIEKLLLAGERVQQRLLKPRLAFGEVE